MIRVVDGLAVPPRLRYVALGDSYTIGTSVWAEDRWPNRLVERLGGSLQLVANLAVNGYKSRDVLEREVEEAIRLRPGFVTLLAGVNDVVREVPEATYRATMTTILDRLLGIVRPERVLVVSTPDYTLTPEGSKYGDPAARSAAIRRFNSVEAALAGARGIAFVDILDLSERTVGDSSLVASDGLHPSGRQYALWIDRIAPVVGGLLATRPPG